MHMSNTIHCFWSKLIESQSSCKVCATSCSPSLLQEGARPLFGRFSPWEHGILFVFEAPNWADTFDLGKGYLTYDQETDPTGRFARVLMVEELGLSPMHFQVTNSVLCLPREKNGGFPVTAQQTKLCSAMVRDQINILDPAVVVPIGGQALKSLRYVAPHPLKSLAQAVASPTQWYDRWLFPVYHTGRQARNGPTGRREALQRCDWRKLREFLDGQEIPIPNL